MTLIDTNILLDMLHADPTWGERSQAAFLAQATAGPLGIIDVIFAEFSVSFPDADSTARFLELLGVERIAMSDAALWNAGQAFIRYRRQGGQKGNVLPDFMIGALAVDRGVPVLTRDARMLGAYFPAVKVVGVG
jgi:predicted nucleic acid-binding protein